MLKVILVISLLLIGCGEKEKMEDKKEKSKIPVIETVEPIIAKNGKIFNSSGFEIQLRGMSTHGLAWYKDYYNEESIKTLVDDWKINLFRIAMYTKEWGGYIDSPSIYQKVKELIDICIKQNIYVIVDWHILSDGNPLTHQEHAIKFFDLVSKDYKNVPNVIYEICNEPNGWANWRNAIKPYAEKIIPIIRSNSPDALIIVGTGSWSQDIQDPVNDPLQFNNIAYALHFYSGTHKEWLQERLINAVKRGVTIFVSEWGMSQASGGGGIYPHETTKWLNLLDNLNVSWANWSLAPKDESSAALRNWAKINGKWEDSELSESGRWVRAYLRSKASEI